MNFTKFYNDLTKKYKKIDDVGVARYENALKNVKGFGYTSVLDIGCKTGTLIHVLNTQEFKGKYTGIDIANKNLDFISRNFKKNKFPIELIEVDISKKVETNTKFDLIFCLETLEHVENPYKSLINIKKHMHKNSTLLISVPNPYYYVTIFRNMINDNDREGHLYAFTKMEMKRLISNADFSNIKIHNTICIFPPTKRFKKLILPAPIGLLSRTKLYVVNI